MAKSARSVEVRCGELSCPKCGAVEMHPSEWWLTIRAFKVSDEDRRQWSQCLVCAGYYSADLSVFTQSAGDPKKGWFSTR